VSRFDASPQPRRTTNPRGDQENPTARTELVEDLSEIGTSHTSLARGIVWADVLAAIAADDQAHHLRDAA
jgi:hypothetical protein